MSNLLNVLKRSVLETLWVAAYLASGFSLLVSSPAAANDFSVAPNRLLLIAAENGDFTKTQQALLAGANPNAQDTAGNSALMLAVAAPSARLLDLVNLLLSYGADVKHFNLAGETPLMWAVANCAPATVVVQRCATPNCSLQLKAVVEALLAHGADVQARSNNNETVLMWAVTSQSPLVVQIVQLLIAHGAPLVTQSNRGDTALMWAAVSCNTQVVALLQTLIAASSGVTAQNNFINAQNNLGMTALMWAAAWSLNPLVVAVANTLLAAEADVNLTDNYGRTALTFASTVSNNLQVPNLILALLQAGATSDINRSRPVLQIANLLAASTHNLALLLAGPVLSQHWPLKQLS
ncbi:MAG TPA: ankyrin repeat domain-containing protein [Candidatus Babeliales bacterium]|nr:ankyrin repeat domain-containing protein [Candidatus Babeliales bacterium]